MLRLLLMSFTTGFEFKVGSEHDTLIRNERSHLVAFEKLKYGKR